MRRVNKEEEKEKEKYFWSLEADNRHLHCCKLNLLMSQAQAHHNYTHRQATKHNRSTVVITVCNLFIIVNLFIVEASYQSWNFVAFKKAS